MSAERNQRPSVQSGNRRGPHLTCKARSCDRRDASVAIIWVGLNTDQNSLMDQGTIWGIVLVEGEFINDGTRKTDIARSGPMHQVGARIQLRRCGHCRRMGRDGERPVTIWNRAIAVLRGWLLRSGVGFMGRHRGRMSWGMMSSNAQALARQHDANSAQSQQGDIMFFQFQFGFPAINPPPSAEPWRLSGAMNLEHPWLSGNHYLR